MEKKCLKCGHVNMTATGDEIEACPSCGAIYSKVEAYMALQAGRSVPRPPAPMSSSSPGSENPRPSPAPRATGGDRGDRAVSIGLYAETMRAESIYPTFRQLVNIFYVLGLIFAALVVMGGIASFFYMGPRAIPGFLGSLFIALLIVVLAKLGKEMWSMLADLSDAAVRTAAASARD